MAANQKDGDEDNGWERTQEHEPQNSFSYLSFQRVKARLIHFEQPVRHMYLDKTDHLTVGIGYMIRNKRKLSDYQWVAKDTGRRATDAELQTDWKKVLKYKSRTWKAKAFGRVTHVEITNANMNLLLQKKIYVYDKELRAALKQWNERIKNEPDTDPGLFRSNMASNRRR